jgi:hypothetical protein
MSRSVEEQEHPSIANEHGKKFHNLLDFKRLEQKKFAWPVWHLFCNLAVIIGRKRFCIGMGNAA